MGNVRLSILLDEGHLTNVRTAVAGAIAAKYLAPGNIKRIGIVGTGIQAHLQLEYLSSVVTCRHVLVWGINEEEVARYQSDMEKYGFIVETTLNTMDILDSCNLIVTTTPATLPLLKATGSLAGIHITAVGSDTPQKQELDSTILGKADLVVADSLSQCLVRGEIYKAVQSGEVTKENVVELGNIIAGNASGRTSDNQLTVADLTGVAMQDFKISTAVYKSNNHKDRQVLIGWLV